MRLSSSFFVSFRKWISTDIENVSLFYANIKLHQLNLLIFFSEVVMIADVEKWNSFCLISRIVQNWKKRKIVYVATNFYKLLLNIVYKSYVKWYELISMKFDWICKIPTFQCIFLTFLHQKLHWRIFFKYVWINYYIILYELQLQKLLE